MIPSSHGGMRHAMQKHTCTNCGKHGHGSKLCPLPITSYGMLLLRERPGHALQVLCIQRRDSLGYVELLRGKYKVGDTVYIKQLLSSMTADEQRRLSTLTFDLLWDGLWGPPVEGTHAYRNERDQSRQKFESLHRGSPTLIEMIQEVGSVWPTPEWGFPKGRRDPHESEYTCAMREMKEETGISEKEIQFIHNLEPISELFMGSNGIEYCHKYFVAFVPAEKEVALDPTNQMMRREVGDIRWIDLKEAETLFRPNQDKKSEILKAIRTLIARYKIVPR